MSYKELLWAIACVFGISAGQILFKIAASGVGTFNGFGMIWRLITNVYFCTAILVYGLTTLAWVSLLRTVPLKAAYPLVGLVFIVVPFLAKLFLDEKLDVRTLLGGGIIIIGVYISVT